MVCHVSYSASVFLTVAITIERFFAVCRPLQYQARVTEKGHYCILLQVGNISRNNVGKVHLIPLSKSKIAVRGSSKGPVLGLSNTDICQYELNFPRYPNNNVCV